MLTRAGPSSIIILINSTLHLLSGISLSCSLAYHGESRHCIPLVFPVQFPQPAELLKDPISSCRSGRWQGVREDDSVHFILNLLPPPSSLPYTQTAFISFPHTHNKWKVDHSLPYNAPLHIFHKIVSAIFRDHVNKGAPSSCGCLK